MEECDNGDLHSAQGLVADGAEVGFADILPEAGERG